MKIYTLNVSQGQFVVVAGKNEAFIVDTFVPPNIDQDTIFVKGALSHILQGKNLIGLIVTGFDDDHFCEKGIKLILHKYRPDWLMYPKYFKESNEADGCFKAIDNFYKNQELKKCSTILKDSSKRFYLSLSSEFVFEIFSPYREDMNSSNNCSIVCKVKERATGATYLITGDTECDRWSSIAREFGDLLKADVLAAPHHGSKNGLTEEAMKYIRPHTTLVSAGVGNQYDHPHDSARRMFSRYSKQWYSTNEGKGQSLLTIADGATIVTHAFSI